MSWQAVAAAKVMRVGSGTRKAVLMMVAEYAHQDGSGCTASIESIARHTEMERHAVGRALTDLAKMGAITRRRDGTRQSIRVNLDYPNRIKDGTESSTHGTESAAEDGTESSSDGTESSTPATERMEPRVPSMELCVPSNGTESSTNRLGTGQNRENTSDAKPSDHRPEIADLCRHLAERSAAHRGTPIVNHNTAGWHRDMRRLLNRGAQGWAKPQPIPATEVHRMIDVIFDRLNEHQGRSRFCWADQIRCPNTLRKQWDQLTFAARKLHTPAAPNGRSRDAWRRHQEILAQAEAAAQ